MINNISSDVEVEKIKYKVVEKFVSINGEGQKAGQLAIFIRFQGCNLNCVYCDTKWANTNETKYELMSASQIVDYIKSTKVKNVTLTGGEPLRQENIIYLLKQLSLLENINVEIETNGSVNIAEVKKINNSPSITLDYKLPESTMEKYMDLTNYEYLEKKDTVKFVCSSIGDLNKAKEIIDKYNLTSKCKVYLSSVFEKITPAEIVEFMKENNMNDINLQLQMHKYIWDPNLKGV
ncbi:putative 7-carboxy-7-deazaguanine synthase QueE [Lachnobacterium bovis]|uniref:7-carboxy-7-deazaguanine synthase n=1 Tax=Lachnobacterium bovis TaxID=140626 RepID=A0A1H9UM15_9FIRM|nr:putative 7-carboxy-7-deazaguanine synthase QueE [Lachnobacterium bovis]SES10570.1 7-carboxy-7-deazaguanine synthase [Lachnobacterium bovis]